MSSHSRFNWAIIRVYAIGMSDEKWLFELEFI